MNSFVLKRNIFVVYTLLDILVKKRKKLTKKKNKNKWREKKGKIEFVHIQSCRDWSFNRDKKELSIKR